MTVHSFPLREYRPGLMGAERAVKAEAMEPEREVHREEPGRRYDPNAVFQLELNSDESDDD